MNKGELVAEISRRTKLPVATVAEVVDSFTTVVQRSVVRGEKVVLAGFGTFHRRSRARRVARNIAENTPMPLPARNVPGFRPGQPFRDAVARRRPPSQRSARTKRL